MKTVILAGGHGTRIRDVADDIPKPMIPIGPYPIIFHIMKIYAHHNYFEECPPDSVDVYPLSAWDLEHCHSIDLVKNDPIIQLGSFHLSPNFPNPFNPITTIPISISYPGFINLTIHDLKGTLVDQWNTFLKVGNHSFVWDAQKLPSGIYFIKVESKQSYDTQKAILLK